MSSVSAQNLVVTRSGYPAIANGSFELPNRHFSLVTGPNGSGKTTLLKAIAGSVIIDRGELCVGQEPNSDVKNVTSQDVRLLRQRVSYIGHSALYMRHIKVLEHLTLCAQLDGSHKNIPDFVLSPQDAMSRFHLEHRSDVRVENLSAGQQRRVHLASSFVRTTQLICVDEPHASLDDTSKELIDSVLAEQFEAGRSMIVATHDPARLHTVATHLIVIANGVATLDSEFKGSAS